MNASVQVVPFYGLFKYNDCVFESRQADWLHRFESCHDYLVYLSAVELHHFILGITLSQRSLKVHQTPLIHDSIACSTFQEHA